MINQRHALLRQAQEAFHNHLLGTIPWDTVIVDKPIPIPSVRGNREQGKFRDIVIAHFGPFRMELLGPFEDEVWPMGKVKVIRANSSVEGRLDPAVWAKVAEWIKEEMVLFEKQMEQGDDDGRIGSGEAWGR